MLPCMHSIDTGDIWHMPRLVSSCSFLSLLPFFLLLLYCAHGLTVAPSLWLQANPSNETFLHLRNRPGPLGSKLLISVLQDKVPAALKAGEDHRPLQFD